MFKPFRYEVEVTAGYHNLERTGYNAGFARDAMVMSHEQVHARIFATQPDGIVLAYFGRIGDGRVPHAPAEVRAACQATAEEMIEHSLLTHEATATYLGIKQLGPAEQAARIATLVDDYADYYRHFSETFDPGLSSSFLQFIIAWTASNFATGSPLLERVGNAPWDAPFTLALKEQPNHRAAAVMELWRNNRERYLRDIIRPAVAAVFSQAGVTGWDIDDEAGWIANEKLREPVEGAIWQALIDTFERESGLPLLKDDRKAAAARRFNERLGEVGFDVATAKAIVDLGNQSEVMAFVDCGSRIDNPSPEDAGFATAAQFFYESKLDDADGVCVYADHPEAQSRNWTMALYRKGDDGKRRPNLHFAARREAALAWLARRTLREINQLRVPPLLAIVVPVKGVDAVYDFLHQAFPIITAGQPSDDQEQILRCVTFYAIDNWALLLHDLKGIDGEWAVGYVRARRDDITPATTYELNTPLETVQHILVNRKLGLQFSRIFPAVSSGGVRLIEQKMQAAGELTQLTPAELENRKQLLISTNLGVTRYWPSY
jgi:hypothetical protein